MLCEVAAILNGTLPIAAQDETYQYKYDNYNRLIEKKEPNKNWQFIVYDRLNRIVATGPSVTPFGGLETETGWMVVFYDNLNRACYSGWYPQANITAASRNSLQATFAGAINHVTKTTTGTIDGLSVFYSSTSLPTGFKLLSVNYYDTYSFPNAPTSFMPVEGQVVFYTTTVLPKGLPTGSWVRTLTAATTAIVGETSHILYDYRARPILARNNNYLGGYTQVKTKVDFSSKTNYTKTEHQRTALVAGLITTTNRFTYSDQDRLLKQTKQVNLDAEQLLTANTYNERGQLLTKKVGGTDVTANTFLQKVDYAYNIRGWLKSINDDATSNLVLNTNEKDLFGFKINYETVQNHTNYLGTALFNGNISETLWRTSNDDILRKYGYKYDNMNRLNLALYIKPEANNKVTNCYNEEIAYDKNGNITNLLRNGDFDNATPPPLTIDNLTYKYVPNTNKLLGVYDAEDSSLGFNDNANHTINDIDYSYDLNGNIKTDNNKGITSIKYNHLNLPVEIIFNNNANTKITYLYTASGEKVKKIVQKAATLQEVTDYLSGYQYRNNVLLFFPTSEGYVNNTVVNGVNKFNYVFNYLDHLGNIRVSYSQDPGNLSVLKIIEENHYYPYGLKHGSYNTVVNSFRAAPSSVVLKAAAAGAGGGGGTVAATNSNKYKFNGQEFQDELSLNLYDMDMRDYDPAIARWTGIDPVVHFSQSTYNAFDGNPVFWADPSWADAYGNHANSSSNSPFAGGNAAVSNTGAWSGGSVPYKDIMGYSTGVVGASAWGDGPAGSVWPKNGGSNQTFYGKDAADVLRSFGSHWVPGPDDEIIDGINVFYSGHWERNSSARAKFDGYSYADILGQGTNGLTVVWGASQLGVERLANANLAADVGEAFGIGAQVAAPRLQAFTSTLGTLGNRVGLAGFILSAAVITNKIYNGDKISTSEAIGFGINSVFAGVAIAAELGFTVAFAPQIATVALVYGALQLGSYFYNGHSLEQNILGR